MNENNISEIIAMAWYDKISFDLIHDTEGLSEKELVALIKER